MRAIQTTTWGTPPTYHASTPNPPPPSPTQIQLHVLATALHRLVRSQALGQHYTVTNATLPYIPGADGVGLDPTTNKRYYFSSLAAGGAFAEVVNVEKAAIVELSEDADVEQVAGLVNPGMASWMALAKRTSGIVGEGGNTEGWSVVILGVTSQSGRVAVEFVRRLGAGRVVGLGRDREKMEGMKGVDEVIVLKKDVKASDWHKMGDVDVVLDYLYGEVAVACLSGLKGQVPTQYVQIGSMAGLEVSWLAALLRSKDVTVRGSGLGAWSLKDLGGEMDGLVRAVERLPRQELKVRKLEEIEEAWKDAKSRTVFVP